MTAVTPLEESTTFISDFGPVPTEMLDLSKSKYEVRMYRMSTDRTKQLGDALGFSAQFESEEVFDAYADVWKDEGYITFEMKTNTRPMTISLRYKSDRWSAVETHTPNKRETEGDVPKTRGVKTIYHAFLEEMVLSRIAELLRVDPQNLANLFFRINLKSKTYALVAAEDALLNFPDAEAFKTAVIPKKSSESTTYDTKGSSEYMSDIDATESAEDLTEDSTPSPELTDSGAPADLKNDDASAELQNDAPAAAAALAEAEAAAEAPANAINEHTARSDFTQKEEPKPQPKLMATQKPAPEPIKSFDATPSAAPERAPMRAEPIQNKPSNSGSQAKYHTYSQSEVDNLIRRSAENVSSSLNTKINQQTKTVEKNLKNHEFAINQTLEKLSKQLEQASAKLDKASAELNTSSAKQVEEFREKLNKELEEFRSNLDKKVLPGMKLLDARLEQLADVKKQTQTQPQTVGGMNPSVLVGVVVAIVIVAVVNLVVTWYAFERISNLEKSHAELMLKSVPSGTSDVPVPDLMKEQINKEQKQTSAPAP